MSAGITSEKEKNFQQRTISANRLNNVILTFSGINRDSRPDKSKKSIINVHELLDVQ